MTVSRCAARLAALACVLIAGFRPAYAADDAPPASLSAAREHLQRGRYEEAREAYAELAKQPADFAVAIVGQSRCLEATGELGAAEELLAAATTRSKDNVLVWARLAEIQLARGDFAKARKSLDQALERDGNHPQARLAQADLDAATGRFQDASDGYRWFVRLYNQAQPEDPELLMLIARGAAQYARWGRVPQVFDFVVNTLCPDALAQDKTLWQAHYTAGSLLLEKYNRAQALPEFRRALAINPQAAIVHAALAEAALQEHDLAEAEQLAARALEINPHLPAALMVQADLKLEVGDVTGARQLVEAAARFAPADDAVLARLATCDLLEDGPPPAQRLQALLANLDDPAVRDAAGASRFEQCLARLARRNPRPGQFLWLVGAALEGRRKFELAELFYRRAIAVMPQLAAPKTSLGMLLMRVGKIEEARKLLDEALDADPYHVRVSNMRKVLKVLEGYTTISSPHFVIHIDAQHDRVLGRYISQYLEQQYPDLVRQFGYEPASRTHFEIYNKARGLSGHEWFSARMIGLPWVQTIGASTGMIVALASPTGSEKPYNWARVVKHEFIHILTLQQTQFNIPHWFTEALAVMNEGFDRPEIWNTLLLERVPQGELMNLDTVNLGFIRPKTPLDWQMAYCQSRLYAQYMVDKFGGEKISELLAAYRDNLTTDQAIPKVFHVDKAQFERGYRAYLDQVVAEIRGGLPADPPMTLAEAERAYQAAPGDPAKMARFASELFEANQRKKARELAEAALAKHKAEPLAAVVMAQLELRAENVPAAIAVLKPALDAKNPHRQVLKLLAQLDVRAEDYSAAEALYRLALDKQPAHLEWLKGLAVVYVKSKQPAKLPAVLEKIAAIDPDDAAVRKRLASLAFEEQRYADAVRYGGLALHVDVADVETHRIIARAHAAQNQPEAAVEEWAVAVELKPDDLELEVELAAAEAAAGKKPAAVERLKKILTRQPGLKSAVAQLKELGG